MASVTLQIPEELEKKLDESSRDLGDSLRLWAAFSLCQRGRLSASLAARLAGLTVVSVMALQRGQPLLPSRKIWPLAALSGLLDGGANVCFVIAAQTGHEPGELIWTGGDTHLYLNHAVLVTEQLSREPGGAPKLRSPRSPPIYHLILDCF